MARSDHWPLFLAVFCMVAARAASAGEGPAAPPKEAPPKPTTHTVQPELFRIEANLKGVFEAAKMTEVVLRPDAWAELTVLQAAPQGTRVKKGDVVLALDTAKIDEAIQDAEAALAAMEPALKLAQEETTALEKSLALDLAAAERAKQAADEDLKRYVEIERALAVKQAEFALKNAANFLAYEQEELRQLEKMYKADDLTEETEEIVLKRQRDAVERAAFGLEQTRIKTERTLQVDLPRQDVATKENAERQAIALPKAKTSIPAALAKKRLELDKLKSDQKKAADKLQKLKKDHEGMVVKAPVDGVVYYGPCVRGNWSKLGQELARGAALKPNDVAMTIVETTGGLLVRAVVPEDQLERLQPGVEGPVTPVGYPSLRLRAKVETVSLIPVSAGNFEATISVTFPKGAPRLVPGMNCTARFVAYSRKDALAVPVAAVFSDEPDEAAPHVFLRKADGTHEKRPVTLGRRAEGKAEILKGLSPGDVVLLERPEAK